MRSMMVSSLLRYLLDASMAEIGSKPRANVTHLPGVTVERRRNVLKDCETGRSESCELHHKLPDGHTGALEAGEIGESDECY